MDAKKVLALILSAVMLCALAGACGKAPEAASEADAARQPAQDAPGGDPLKVILLVNGNLGDKGFYDSAAGGLYRMEQEMGAEIKIVEMGRDETSYEGNFLDVSEQDWDLIISGTWGIKELSQQTAAQFPDRNYIYYDGAVDRTVVTEGNMMGIAYLSNEGGFMAGCLAALMLDSGDAKIDPQKRILGFVGSMDSPNINDFLVGYIEGIRYIDPEIRLLTSYVGSFEDVPKCLEMTTQLYNQGAQIVYAPASQSMLGALTASGNVGKYLIAQDTDLWEQMKDSDPELAENVLSSALKKVGDSLVSAAQGYLDGSMKMDQDYVLGLASGAVGLADNDHYREVVPEEIRTRLDEIEQKVISGEIKVGTAIGVESDKIAEQRDSMKP